MSTPTTENNFAKIIAHAKEYGFVFPSSEIYDGLSAVYDYGSNGVELKNNLKNYWWKTMTQYHQNIVGIDSAIFMHPQVWKASGHIDNFSDPLIDNKDSNKRYRVDHLIEAHANILTQQGKQKEGELLIATTEKLLANNEFEAVKKIIIEQNIVCEVSKTCNWTDIRQFNLMFSTKIGSGQTDGDTIYLRPETAQGIFVNFLNIQKTARMRLPFGIAQVGKAFRNEIIARQFIFRMREFEQMEMQFFVPPGTQQKWFAHWKQARLNWHLELGIAAPLLAYHDHLKPAHYADAAVDIEYQFPFGFKEIEGIHSRTDFDLKNHELLSGKKMQYFDNELNKNYIPFVIETSVGLDRLVLMHLANAFTEETIRKEDGTEDQRTVLKINEKIAPIKLAIFPLLKKDGLPEIALSVLNDCNKKFKCFYEEKDAIGRRYRRQDAIGTPFCITIDHQTKDDQTVTIRYRDSMQQERIPLENVKKIVEEKISF